MSGMDTNIVGAISGTGADVDAYRQLMVVTENDAVANPLGVGGIRIFSEVDQGLKTGVAQLWSPEADNDYRLRVSQDLLLDEEVFNYTAQNTGKHTYTTGTVVNAWTAGNMTTNSANTAVFATGTGTQFATYASFANIGTQTLSADTEVGFSAQPSTNVFIEWGLGLPGANGAAPADGVFFRLSSAGLQGIASSNGTETSTGVFPLANGVGTWVYQNNKKYQFIVYMGGIGAEFWVNDGTGAVKLGSINLPAAQGRICMASGVQFFIKHRITGGSSVSAIQAMVGAYNVRVGGSNVTTTASTQGNRLHGSYQGLAGGTMGGLQTYVNSTNPTAATPVNTALTANLPGGLGGQGSVTALAAAVTDLIWSSYQVPAGTVNIQGRRLVLRGIRVDLVNMGAAVATTPTTIQFRLAYGHNAVSLATADAATTKSPRSIALGFATWAVGAAIGAQPQFGPIFMDLGDAPVFVNPGEFVQLVGKFINGTATASQVINFTYTPIFGWE